MAKKSKTQRAKASANRQAKKAAAELADQAPVVEEEAPKAKRFGKDSESSEKKQAPKQPAKSQSTQAAKKKPKKKRFQFLRDVKAEMKRVTWPTKQDVWQWTGVVLVALIFFSLFCIVLDDWIVTPILFGLSSLGGLING